MVPDETPYDSIPYASHSFAQSRPERLSAIAKLFGLDAPPVESSRVLELGCAMGGNLIAMAQDQPGSRFVGIDASSRQISEGWKAVDALGLKNIQLKHLDILDVGEDFGEFDYIISHGVFSWVPPAVQNRMLELCQRHLAPRGVAYISYNTYPGWHVRGIVRDMMRYRGQQFADPEARLSQAKSLVGFVAEASRGDDSPYKKLLQDELQVISRSADYYLHHDHLEENNHPIYFHEFARKLAVNGLQYLGEAVFSTMVSTNFAPEVAKTLQELGAHDILQMEQYMDFVRCRYFRQTLICRSAVPLNRQLEPELVKGLLLTSSAQPVEPSPDSDGGDVETFRTADGHGINCRSPLTKAALRILMREWPMPVAFPDLLEQSRAEAEEAEDAKDDPAQEDFLAGEILASMAAGVVGWRLVPVPFTTVVEERPLTTASARLQASFGTTVTNMLGQTVTLDGLHTHLLRHLDGGRNLKELVESVLSFLKAGGHTLRRDGDGAPVEDEAEMRTLLGPALESALQNLSKQALLVAGGA